MVLESCEMEPGLDWGNCGLGLENCEMNIECCGMACGAVCGAEELCAVTLELWVGLQVQ